MLFHSWSFVCLFLPITAAVYFSIPSRQARLRKLWLIGASLFFYGYWKPEYVPLLLFSILGNYWVAGALIRSAGTSRAKWILRWGIGLNLLTLGYFKYTNFFFQAVGPIALKQTPVFDIALPLAISFFTFTQIGYLVDVSRDRNAHYGFLDYTLFVTFFPHLIAGPIIRHWEILPQFSKNYLRVSANDLAAGLALFFLGLVQKIFMADPLSKVADPVFLAVQNGAVPDSFTVLLGTLAFAFQIYFDFSGYSDMAIGLARIFGIVFPSNFDSPYRASSMSEFWSRWHITLTRFLREYVYFPLGGNRVGPIRHAVNIFATMLLSGLWHGAAATFVLWGALHGLFLVIEQQWGKLRARWRWKFFAEFGVPLAWAFTFAAVLFTWVFFRADSVVSALTLAGRLVGYGGWSFPDNFFPSVVSKTLIFLGFRPLAATPGLFAYTTMCRLVALAFVFAVLVPNPQRLLARPNPPLQSIDATPRFSPALRPAFGFVLGILFFFIVRSFFQAQASPFLYFNF